MNTAGGISVNRTRLTSIQPETFEQEYKKKLFQSFLAEPVSIFDWYLSIQKLSSGFNGSYCLFIYLFGFGLIIQRQKQNGWTMQKKTLDWKMIKIGFRRNYFDGWYVTKYSFLFILPNRLVIVTGKNLLNSIDSWWLMVDVLIQWTKNIRTNEHMNYFKWKYSTLK